MSPTPPFNRRSIRAAQIVFIVGIVLMMLAPSVAMVIGTTGGDTLGEKRRLRNWPAWPRNSKAIRTLPHDIEAFIKDRFALRQPLIRLHGRLTWSLLRTSPVSSVLPGRDGWIFYNSAAGGDADEMADCTGHKPLTDAELNRITAEFQRRHDVLKQRGIPYVVLIPPNKSTIYREQLPPGFQRRGPSPFDQLVAAAPAQCPGVTIIELRPQLAEKKRDGILYLQTDTHWNEAGALIGTRELLRAIRVAGVNVRVPDITDYNLTTITNTPGGDLARMLGLHDLVREPVIPKYWPANPEASPADPHTEKNEILGTTTHGQSRTNLPALLIWHDSFGAGMIPFLDPCFSRVTYKHGYTFDEQTIEAANPAIVVQQIVERNLRDFGR